MSRDHPLAERLRRAQDSMKPRPSNREIAKAVGVSSPTVDRLMNGEVDTKLENLDGVADYLGVPRREARQLADLPATDGNPYTGPPESRLLTEKQRTALDDLIKSFVGNPSIGSAGGDVIRRSDWGVAKKPVGGETEKRAAAKRKPGERPPKPSSID